jgi:hypothetical protein
MELKRDSKLKAENDLGISALHLFLVFSRRHGRFGFRSLLINPFLAHIESVNPGLREPEKGLRRNQSRCWVIVAFVPDFHDGDIRGIAGLVGASKTEI